MQQPFNAKLLYKSTRGSFPALKGELYESDVLIGTFRRGATRQGFIPPIQYKFFSSAAQARFDNFADCLSIEETIEAIIP